MNQYKQLADELKQKAAQLSAGEQYWIGLAGAPGSGKSTVARAIKEQLGDQAAIIPMDGYHYYRKELDAMDNPIEAHKRRGAPYTFNAERLVDDLIKARKEGKGSFPGFDHGVGDPVEDEIGLSKTTRIVLVEGIYLLLDDEPWCRLKEKVFDESWFIDVPVAECNRRVVERHITTGLTREQAQLRVDTNDALNAELITRVSPKNADRMISNQ